ncbi:MAG: NTP transferase domain-containing protein [Propionibacteriaceae bacterium]|jgi:mannose-1-phosphate guanylyltransferase|nr:NTP transferase domain-containing protein [Propionibacteriaceae bacterium]
MRYIVIMAGGSGTRLWPLSRTGHPKQLLPLIDGQSLLRLAYERARAVVADDRIVICTGAAYLDAVAEQLPDIPAANLLGEPVGRDSLNAVAWSTAVIFDRDPDATVAILSADHVIAPVEGFAEALGAAFRAAEQDHRALVTLGVVPTSAHTGFGYLHRGRPAMGLTGTWQVLEFAEKPAKALAETYLAAGDWWWNSGMFCWRAATFLWELRELLPQTAAAIKELVADPGRLAEIYPTLEKVSVDYGVMEPVSHGAGTAHVLAVPLTTHWGDIGGFPALAEHLTQLNGNAVTGAVTTLDSTGNILINDGPEGSLIAVVGLQDTIVVSHDGVTLVCPKRAAENIKQLVERVRAEGGASHV